MRAVVQRVKEASVTVESQVIGQIRGGLMVLLGVEEGDEASDIRYMADKVPNLRIFEDEAGKMNRSLLDVSGSLLVVSQFTLLGDARGTGGPASSLPPNRRLPCPCMNRWWSVGVGRESALKPEPLARKWP